MAKNKKKANKPKVSKSGSADAPEEPTPANSDEISPQNESNGKVVESDTDDTTSIEANTEPQRSKSDGDGSVPESPAVKTEKATDSPSIVALQAEVARLTLKLTEQEQKSDDGDISKKLEETEKQRDDIQAAYDNLLSKLSGMKSLFSKMKESEKELAETKTALESLTEENEVLSQENKQLKLSSGANSEHLEKTVAELKEKNELLNSECEKLSTTNLTQRRQFQLTIDELQDEKYNLENQNNELSKKILTLKSQSQQLSIENQENVLQAKNLQLKIEELQDQLGNNKAEFDELSEANNQLKLQITAQDEKHSKSKKELEDLFDTQDAKIIALTEKNSTTQAELDAALANLENVQQQVKQIDELKSEINTKQLLIGKLRHEAIILNEHLTKSLTMLKLHTGEGNNTIDKELISNIVIQFLQFPRGDSKKFEALQLIAALLEWNEEKKIAAGLSHTQIPNGTDSKDRQSFVNLWTDFLEKESTKN